MFQLFYVSLFLSLCTCMFARTTYYVDAVHGNDSNAGTSVAQAWRTVERVNRLQLLPGDAVLFRRGQVWRETLNISSSGTPTKPLLFGAFGQGMPPTISGSDPIESWTKDDSCIDTLCTWYAECCRISGHTIIWRNGSRLVRVPPDKLLRTGEWSYDSKSGRIHIISTANPSSDGARYEVATRTMAITAQGASNIVIRDLALAHVRDVALLADVGLHASRNWTIENCVVEGALHEGISVGRSARTYGLTDGFVASRNTISDIGGDPRSHAASISVAFGEAAHVSGNVIVLAPLLTNGYVYGILYRHGRQTSRHPVIEHNYVTGSANVTSYSGGSIAAGDVHSLLIQDNCIDATNIAIHLDETDAQRGDGPRYTRIVRNYIRVRSPVPSVVLIENSPHTHLTNNSIGTTRSRKIVWIRSDIGGSSSDSLIANNVMTGTSGSDSVLLQIGENNARTFTAGVNILHNRVCISGYSNRIIAAYGTQAIRALDRNSYCRSQPAEFLISGTVFHSVTELRAGSNYESHTYESKGSPAEPESLPDKCEGYRKAKAPISHAPSVF